MFLYDPVTSIPGSVYLFSLHLYHLLLSPPSESRRVSAIAPSTTRTDRTIEQNTPEEKPSGGVTPAPVIPLLCVVTEPWTLWTQITQTPPASPCPSTEAEYKEHRFGGEPQRGFLILPLFLPAPNQLWTSTWILKTPREEDDSLPW